MFEDITDLEQLTTDYERAQYLQSLLISRVTGEEADGAHYVSLRKYFLDKPETARLISEWIRASRSLSQLWEYMKHRYGTYRERRQFIWAELHPLLEQLESLRRLPPDKAISRSLRQFDLEGVHSAWHKALERKATDPEGAITSSRTLLESVCKHILDSQQVEYDASHTSLPQLYKLTARQLNLSPDQHSEQIFKQILGGCAAVVGGLGSLRNSLGDAHGKGRMPVRPAPRHAELAVNLAGAMAMFLVETYLASPDTDSAKRPQA